MRPLAPQDLVRQVDVVGAFKPTELALEVSDDAVRPPRECASSPPDALLAPTVPRRLIAHYARTAPSGPPSELDELTERERPVAE